MCRNPANVLEADELELGPNLASALKDPDIWQPLVLVSCTGLFRYHAVQVGFS